MAAARRAEEGRVSSERKTKHSTDSLRLDLVSLVLLAMIASASVAGSSVGSDETLLGRVGGRAGPSEVETLVRDVLGGEAGSLLLVEGVDDLEMPGKHVAVGLDVDGVGLGLGDCGGNLDDETEDVLLRCVDERLHLVSPDEQFLLGRLLLCCSSLEVDGLVLPLLCHGEELLNASGPELPLVARLLRPELGGDLGLKSTESKQSNKKQIASLTCSKGEF